ncbi:MAG: 30S ribosomal protein S8 [Deltaproteobacteria bacterium]|nr:30S ribosomal protein S8 [Deltaproteobacteria bacterium]
MAIAKVLERAGFIKDVRAETQEGFMTLAMTIRYDDRGKPLIDGIRRVSKPGRRVYVGARDVWKVRNGLGISVISTSKGILSDEGAREASIGGEVVCEVW